MMETDKYMQLFKNLGIDDKTSILKIIEEIKSDVINTIQDQSIPLRLKITYSDGDSFKIETEIDELDFIWHNYKIASENLQAIKKHSEFLEDLEWCHNNSDRETLIEKAKQNWWFVQDKPEDGIYGRDLFDHSIYLKKDDGVRFMYSTPWTGYFASLQNVELIIGESA